ncbi:hypothetical protein WAI453_007498 [Rhynchosporium graminicola]
MSLDLHLASSAQTSLFHRLLSRFPNLLRKTTTLFQSFCSHTFSATAVAACGRHFVAFFAFL